MICSACGFESPKGFEFCGSCAAPLAAGRRAEEGAEKVGSALGLIHACAFHGLALHLGGEARAARNTCCGRWRSPARIA